MNREWYLGLMTDAYGKAFDVEVKSWNDKGLTGPEVVIAARNRGIEAAYDALQLPAPQAPQIDMSQEQIEDAIDQAEKTWILSGANLLGPKVTFMAARILATLKSYPQAPQIEWVPSVSVLTSLGYGAVHKSSDPYKPLLEAQCEKIAVAIHNHLATLKESLNAKND